MSARCELLEMLRQRYREAERSEKSRILDESVSVTGYRRKHAIRLLRGSGSTEARDGMPRNVRYGDGVQDALAVFREASDRMCGKRLHVLLPSLVKAMERHGHPALSEGVQTGVQAMDAAADSGANRAGLAGSAPGFMEGGLVARSGPAARGSFPQSPAITDIATGWTECAPVPYREQTLVRETPGELWRRLPFDLPGFDVDSDSVFMNGTLLEYCEGRGTGFTRSRPWHRNDRAFAERKNGSVVRRVVGYRRLEGVPAAAALSRLYGTARLSVNFFQPSFRLSEKTRDGARARKSCHRPAAPCRRLLDDARTSQAVRDAVSELQDRLDPVRLMRQMRRGQQEIADLADGVGSQAGSEETSLDAFLAALRTAWEDGEVRPAARPKPRPKRGRLRPDPFGKVTDQLRERFDAEPLRTSRQLLEQLQEEHPGLYPDSLLRTLQRRVRIRRQERVRKAIFGSSTDEWVPQGVQTGTGARADPECAGT